jgi:hypothetical protein
VNRSVRERNAFILADLVQIRAEEKPERDVLTFEHYSLDGGATPDEVRTYADLQVHSNRIAAELIEKGMQPGDRFAIMMRNHPEFVEASSRSTRARVARSWRSCCATRGAAASSAPTPRRNRWWRCASRRRLWSGCWL